MVIYSAGLRVSEAVNLQIKDIDSSRMTLHIKNCKNRKERYVILSPTVYAYLRIYWKYCKFTNYVFPGRHSNKPLTTRAAGNIYYQAKKRAGIKKAGGIHTLRHAFATHMLEAGENLFTIKKLLGHSSIRSTIRYLSFVPTQDSKVKSPIDQLEI